MRTIKIFGGGGGEEVVDGVDNSEVCLKWGGGGEEVIKESQLKFKGVKAETVHGGEGLEGVTTSAPPQKKKFIIHYVYVLLVQVELLCQEI